MRSVKMLTCLLAIAVLGAPAWAQDDRPARTQQRVRQLSPEKAQAAWEWQAKGVAHGLKLDEATTAKLVDGYVTSRQGLADTIEKTRVERSGQRTRQGQDAGDDPGSGQRQRGRGRGRGGVDPEIAEQARASMEKSFAAFLTPEQATEAIKPLGSFRPQWDRMVNVVAAFGMEPEKTYAALAPIQAYVTEFSELRRSGDWRAMREEMMAARDELDSALGKVLTDAQLTEFREKTTSRRRGRGGRRAGGVSPEGI